MTESTQSAAPQAKKSKPRAKKASATTSASKAAPKTEKSPVEIASSIITELAKTNFEETVETARAVFKSGDIKTAVELQNELLRTTFKRNLEAAREINEIAVSSFREAMGPYAERFTEAMSKLRAA